METAMPHPMEQYHDLLRAVLERGVLQHNARTGEDCLALAGWQLQFDLQDGFPAVTTKQLFFKSVVGELLGFFRGYDNAADFRALGCRIWDQNANETRAWLDNVNRKGTDDLGRIYGVQWTKWRDSRVARSQAERDALAAKGYAELLFDRDRGAWMMERSINQLEDAARKIMTNPSDRRIIISAWRPDEFDQMALPPCHVDYRWVPFEDRRELHVVMSIRSWDLFLGSPFNVASTALFLAIMARLTGYTARTVTIHATNAHIYGNHVDQVREQLARSHFDQPQLSLSDRIAPLASVDQIPGAFARIEPADIELLNYRHHAPIRAPMAA